MKSSSSLVAITLLGLAAVAGAQINMPDPTLPGSSYHTAVRIVSTNDIMLDRFIRQWLHTHYPGWTADPHELTEFAGARYAIVYISAPNNTPRRVYFRVARSEREEDDDIGAPPF